MVQRMMPPAADAVGVCRCSAQDTDTTLASSADTRELRLPSCRCLSCSGRRRWARNAASCWRRWRAATQRGLPLAYPAYTAHRAYTSIKHRPLHQLLLVSPDCQHELSPRRDLQTSSTPGQRRLASPCRLVVKGPCSESQADTRVLRQCDPGRRCGRPGPRTAPPGLSCAAPTRTHRGRRYRCHQPLRSNVLLPPSAPPAHELPLPPAPLLDSARPGAAARRGAGRRLRPRRGRLHPCGALPCSGAPPLAQLAAPLLLAARLRHEQRVNMQVHGGATFGHTADVRAQRQRLHLQLLFNG
jgi:hypothetical protein